MKGPGHLRVGVAAARNLFDAPREVNEELLATVLREVAAQNRDCGDLGYGLFLEALADALDHPEAEHRLALVRRKGRPRGNSPLYRAFTIGPHVEKLTESGWKKEAAVQQVMTETGLGRTSVLKACADYEKLRIKHPKLFDEADGY